MRPIFTIHSICTMYNVSRSAFDKISGDLSQKIDTLASDFKNFPDTAVTPHKNLFMSPSGSPLASEDIPIDALLAKAKPLPLLDRNDFKDLKHWESTEYRRLRKQTPKTEDTAEDELPAPDVGSSSSGSDAKPKSSILSCFLEDKDGNPISETEKSAIFAVAGAIWLSLLQNNRAPESYRQANIGIRLQWEVLMESNFECLRYCDSHWKVSQLWINHYSSWMGNAKKKIARQEAKAQKAKAEAEARAKAEGVASDAVIVIDDDRGEGKNNEDDADIEEVSINENNKRGNPDSDKTTKSKRARVEPKESTLPAPPTPIKITTKRARVRKLFSLNI